MSSISSFKPFPIDKLESDNSNWIVYSTQMLNCVRASGLAKHLDGRAVEPDELKYDSKTRKWLDAAGNAANDAVAGDFEKHLDEWQMVQAHIKSQIFFSIPESLLISVRNLPTANYGGQSVYLIFCAKQTVDVAQNTWGVLCKTHGECCAKHMESVVQNTSDTCCAQNKFGVVHSLRADISIFGKFADRGRL